MKRPWLCRLGIHVPRGLWGHPFALRCSRCLAWLDKAAGARYESEMARLLTLAETDRAAFEAWMALPRPRPPLDSI